MSEETKRALEALGSYSGDAPVETPRKNWTVERYYAPLRLVYKRIWADRKHEKSDQGCLQDVIFAVKCTVVLERLCPALLVPGAHNGLPGLCLYPHSWKVLSLLTAVWKRWQKRHVEGFFSESNIGKPQKEKITWQYRKIYRWEVLCF